MDCPHCERLRREFSCEAEREARAILAQRSSWLRPRTTGTEGKYDTLQAIVDDSRKKQAHLYDLLQDLEGDHHFTAA